jgi:hypothetical protein
MTYFVPCSSCGRHLRAAETACPFCSTVRDPEQSKPPVLPRVRLSRAATLAFSAMVSASAIAVGCGGDTDDDEDAGPGEGTSGASGASDEETGGTSFGGGPNSSGGSLPVAVYGAPAPSGGTNATGGRPATGGTVNNATGGRPATGGTVNNAGSPPIGGSVAVYGAPPLPIGGSPASAGAPSAAGGVPAAMPVYGASPPPQNDGSDR